MIVYDFSRFPYKHDVPYKNRAEYGFKPYPNKSWTFFESVVVDQWGDNAYGTNSSIMTISHPKFSRLERHGYRLCRKIPDELVRVFSHKFDEQYVTFGMRLWYFGYYDSTSSAGMMFDSLFERKHAEAAKKNRHSMMSRLRADSVVS